MSATTTFRCNGPHCSAVAVIHEGEDPALLGWVRRHFSDTLRMREGVRSTVSETHDYCPSCALDKITPPLGKELRELCVMAIAARPASEASKPS